VEATPQVPALRITISDIVPPIEREFNSAFRIGRADQCDISIKHEYVSRQHVEISFIRTRRAIACRVKDPGQGFSLEELRHAAINNSPEDLFSHVAVREEQGLRPGGFGMLLAKKLVDELIYNEQGNEVVLVKYLDSPPASSIAKSE